MADSATTVSAITILFPGACWARRQLHAGIGYVSVGSELRESLSSIEGFSIGFAQGSHRKVTPVFRSLR